MRLSTDQLIFCQHGFLKLNATIVYTWGLMLVLTLGAKLITRRLTTGISISRWQCALEIIVLDLADVSLDARITDLFIQRLHALNDQRIEELPDLLSPAPKFDRRGTLRCDRRFQCTFAKGVAGRVVLQEFSKGE